MEPFPSSNRPTPSEPCVPGNAPFPPIMMKTIAVLLLLSLPALDALAQTPREIYPPDFKPLPCAAKNVCSVFPRVDFARYAGSLRKLPLRQKFVDEHWDELVSAFAPLCTKIANCLAVPTNTSWPFCTDFMRPDFLATADRFAKGSDDRDEWTMAALVWFMGLDKAVMAGQKEAQECLASQPPTAERKLDAWITPETIGETYNGNLTVYALDAETHVPVMATVAVEGQELKPASDSPTGHAITYYKFPWPVTFNFVPNAAGHRDLVIPNVIVTAAGYATATLPLPIHPPKVILEMQPPASQLHKGTNTVTVVAKDAVTGNPVEMRVLAGQKILGNTNKSLVLELPSGTKRPEIWATSLFHRYGDVVVAQAE